MSPRRCIQVSLVFAVVAEAALCQGHGAFVANSDKPEPVGLLEVVLADGSATAIDVHGLAAGYETSRIEALTVASEDALYAVVGHPSLPDHLYEIDTSTWVATFLVEIDLGFPADLELDEDGILWATTGGNLYQVDPTSGVLTKLPTTMGDLSGVAYRDGLLFSVRPRDDGAVGTLVTIDRTTGSVTPISDLSGLRGVTFLIVALDFDEAGHLWLLSHFINSVTSIPDILSDLSEVPDASTGEVTHRVSVADGSTAFTFAHNSLLMAIPTLDMIGIAFLVLTLLAVGMSLLRNREGQPVPDGLGHPALRRPSPVPPGISRGGH